MTVTGTAREAFAFKLAPTEWPAARDQVTVRVTGSSADFSVKFVPGTCLPHLISRPNQKLSPYCPSLYQHCGRHGLHLISQLS